MKTRLLKRFLTFMAGLTVAFVGTVSALPQAHALSGLPKAAPGFDPLFTANQVVYNSNGTAIFSGTATPGQVVLVNLTKVMGENEYLGAVVAGSDNTWSVTVKWDGNPAGTIDTRYQIKDLPPEELCKFEGGVPKYHQYPGRDDIDDSTYYPQPAGSDNINRYALCAASDTSLVRPEDVKITETFISNEAAFSNYPFSSTFYDFESSPCSEAGCVSDVKDIPAITGVSVPLNGSGNTFTGSADSFMPAASAYTAGPGVYSWVAREPLFMILYNYFPRYARSGAEYRIRASIKQTASGLEYNWVTIEKLTDDAGNALKPTVMVDDIKFVNVSEDLGDVQVKKEVVNTVGRPEEGPYAMEAVFTWPANFNGVASGDKWTKTVPAVKIESGQDGVTDATCTPNQPSAGKTKCTFKLAAGKTVKISDIPVGSTYTVTETSLGNYDKSISSNVGGNTVPVRKWYTNPGPAIMPPNNEADCNAMNPSADPTFPRCVWDAETNTGRIIYPDNSRGPDQVLVTVTNTYKSEAEELVPIYRMYDGIEHLYVNNDTERDALVARGWKYEGVAFYTPKTSSIAVHRLFQPATGDHHYTSTPEEIATLTSKHGWKDEGVLFYGDDAKRVELKRLFMAGLGKGEHLHTADPNELKALTEKHGWDLEGISFYVAKYGE